VSEEAASASEVTHPKINLALMRAESAELRASAVEGRVDDVVRHHHVVGWGLKLILGVLALAGGLTVFLLKRVDDGVSRAEQTAAVTQEHVSRELGAFKEETKAEQRGIREDLRALTGAILRQGKSR
jgi:hypothetical protein